MIPLNLKQLEVGLDASEKWISSDAWSPLTQVVTDSRLVQAGSVFVALKGDRFDAHDFLEPVVDVGAFVLVVSSMTEERAQCLLDLARESGQPLAIFKVADTLVGLQKLANFCRHQMPIPVIGVTGSNGKTSTKDFLRSVLSQKFSVSSTKGNFNNHIGLPLTILDAKEQDEIAVWEMGMNHPGEIAELCAIVAPTHAVVSSIGTAHIEFFEDQRAIAYEKASIAAKLPKDGVLFAPSDTLFDDVIEEVSSTTVRYVGDGQTIEAVDIRATQKGESFTLVIEGKSTTQIVLPVLGKHMVSNALLAAAVGLEFELSIEQIKAGLEGAALSSGRLQVINQEGVALIDDTYNANPDSMLAAIETLTTLEASGSKVLVFGKLGELGGQTESGYQRVAQAALNAGLDLVVVGDEAKPMALAYGDEANFFACKNEASRYLRERLQAGDVALFKGSRAARMEEVLENI